MDLSWDRLRIFDAVARTGSVTQAAKLLYLTGPAVSQQLRRIEAEVGAKVVEPEGRGLRLTAVGQMLAERAREMADLMQQVENELQNDQGATRELRVAAPASVLREILVPALVSLRARPWANKVRVFDGETVQHLEQLQAGELDLVLAESWDALPLQIPARVQSTLLFRQPLFATVAQGHRLAQQDAVSLADLAEERWATCAEGSGSHVALVQAAREQGFELDVAYFLADHVTQCEVIRTGLAVGCAPRMEREQDVISLPLRERLGRDIFVLTERRVSAIAHEELMTQLLATVAAQQVA